MGKRAGLLGLLLVMALGSVAAAQSSSPSSLPPPSPVPTPLFAPDDLALTIPSEVKSHGLTIEAADTEAAAGEPELREEWRDLLPSIGKVPSDLEFVTGRTSPSEPFGATTQVAAIRVDGVGADALVEPWFRFVARVDPTDLPAGARAVWQDIDGRSVLVLTEDGYTHWAFLYPKGEVLFVAVGDGDLTVEDVLAELP